MSDPRRLAVAFTVGVVGAAVLVIVGLTMIPTCGWDSGQTCDTSFPASDLGYVIVFALAPAWLVLAPWLVVRRL